VLCLIRYNKTRPHQSSFSEKDFDGKLRLWNLSDGQFRGIIDPSGDGLPQMAFATEGDVLVTINKDALVELWKVSDLQRFQKIELNFGRKIMKQFVDNRTSVALSPDGTLLAISHSFEGSYVVRIWDTQNGQQIQEVADHKQNISCLAFAPDNRSLAIGTWDGDLSIRRIR
jgi:WD40 repeat protein